jgi:hypothetical protein
MGRWLLWAALSAAGALIASPSARAADVRVRVPEGCGQKADVVDQVDVLLGRPLASVSGVTFEVQITAAPGGKWRLRLDTIETGGGKSDGNASAGASGETSSARKTRELSAATCAELADAAAMAIALTVRSIDGDGDGQARPAPEGNSPRRPPSTDRSSSTAVPPLAAAPDATVKRVAFGASPSERMRAAVAIGAIGDAGSLPGVGAGLELSGWVQLRAVRLAASGALLAPRDKHLSDGSGGTFQIAFGALEVCAPRALGQSTFFACGGFELGYLWAEGIGVTRPRQGGSLWEAARAEVGLALVLGPNLALVMRGGASVPLARPDFALGGQTSVHQPSSLVARLGLGVEFGF